MQLLSDEGIRAVAVDGVKCVSGKDDATIANALEFMFGYFIRVGVAEFIGMYLSDTDKAMGVLDKISADTQLSPEYREAADKILKNRTEMMDTATKVLLNILSA